MKMHIIEIYVEEANQEILNKARREFNKIAKELGLDVFCTNIQTKEV